MRCKQGKQILLLPDLAAIGAGKHKDGMPMDMKIDLEHIKSLKEFTRKDRVYLGQSVFGASSEDPDIFLACVDTREGLISHIVVVGKRSFAFGIESRLAKTLKTYESDNLMNIWIDEILCSVVDYSSGAGTYLDYSTQRSFSSAEERNAIVGLLENLIAALGQPNPSSKYKTWPTRVMFTARAKEQLMADRIVGTGNL